MRILLLVDSRNWAFEGIARQIQEHVRDARFDVAYYPEFLAKFGPGAPQSPRAGYTLPEFDASELRLFDVVVCFWYGTAALCFDCFPPSTKRVVCVYDYCTWPARSPSATALHRERMLDAVAQADVVMHACPAVRRLLIDECSALPERLLPCVDGTALDKWPFHPMRAAALNPATTLRVGWVGNSKTHGGAVKRFAELRDALRSVKNAFEFRYVDAAERRVPQCELVDFYHSIDVYVCFSSAEGTPNPLLEAAACGRPFISTDVGVVPLLLQDARRLKTIAPPGFVLESPAESASVNDVIRLLRRLNRRRGLLGQMSLSARAVVELGGWDWSKKAQQFQTAFDHRNYADE